MFKKKKTIQEQIEEYKNERENFFIQLRLIGVKEETIKLIKTEIEGHFNDEVEKILIEAFKDEKERDERK